MSLKSEAQTFKTSMLYKILLNEQELVIRFDFFAHTRFRDFFEKTWRLSLYYNVSPKEDQI